jgi:hypothetical protein
MSNLSSIHFTDPWHTVDDSQVQALDAELQRELSPEHLLFGQPVSAVARRRDCDDVLFRFGRSPERYAVVHLTGAGKRETSSKWPTTKIYASLDQFVEKMRQDSIEFGASA